MASRYKREGRRAQRSQATTPDLTEHPDGSSLMKHKSVRKNSSSLSSQTKSLNLESSMDVGEIKDVSNNELLQKFIEVENAITFYLSRGRMSASKRVIDLSDLFNRCFDASDGDCQERLLAILLDFAPSLYVLNTSNCRLYVPNGGNRVTRLRECWIMYERKFKGKRVWKSSHLSAVATKEEIVKTALSKIRLPQTSILEKRRSSRLLGKDDFKSSDQISQLNNNDRKKARIALSEQFIIEGMSLEQRVHARAQATSLVTATSDSGKMHPDKYGKRTNSSQSFKAVGVDLLQVADALRSYFRSNSHAGKVRSAAKVGELVNHLRGTSSEIKSGGQRERSKVIVQKLLDLVKAVPHWVKIETVVHGKATPWKGGRNLNDAILRTNPKIDYAKMVRVALGGRSKDDFGSQRSPERKRSSFDISNQNVDHSIAPTTPLKKRNLSDSLSVSKKVSSNKSISKVSNQKNGKPKHRELGLQKKKGNQYGMQQELRINNELIFGHRYDNHTTQGDPDFISGYLKVSDIGDNRSPNGLKRLFSEMNCGKRI